MSFVRTAPLLAIPLVIYNIILFSSGIDTQLATSVYDFTLPSSAVWSISGGDLFIIAGLLLLGIEVFKATRTGQTSIIDHALSTLVLVIFLIEFVTVAGCGNSIFFILTLMTVIDVIAGFSISILSAHRDITVMQ